MTRTKQLWTYFLDLRVRFCGVPLPAHCRPVDEMISDEVESLVAHYTRLRDRTVGQWIVPRTYGVYSFNQPRPVTWTKLIRDRWVLVASSDAQTSCLSLFEIDALYCGATDAVASAYFSGPIAHGAVETTGTSVVIAVEVRSRTPGIELLGLCDDEDSTPAICRLATLSGLAHLRALHGDYVAAASSDGVSIPSVADWKTGARVRLASLPDRSGGCVCMAIHDDIAVALWPSRLSLFRLTPCHGCLRATVLHSQTTSEAIGQSLIWSADIRFATEDTDTGGTSDSLRLLARCTSGIYLFKMPLGEVPGALQLGWSMPYLPPSEVPAYAMFPRFDRHPSSISFLSFGTTDDRPVMLQHAEFTTRWWSTSMLFGPESFRVCDASLPALYYMPTYDLDEALGIAVLGNGYGELALCDLSRSRLPALRRCLETIALPRRQESWVRMPKEPVPCALFQPHPCDCTSLLCPDEALLELWRAHAPADIPAGHNTDWETGKEAGIWTRFMPHACFTFGWHLEHAHKILGQPVPLFRRPGTAFFAAGGVYYVLLEADERLFAAPPGTAYGALVAIAQAGQPVENTLAQMPKDGIMQRYALAVAHMWTVERELLGRDCMEDLRARIAQRGP